MSAPHRFGAELVAKLDLIIQQSTARLAEQSWWLSST
jgi:hypothetical protein